MDEHKPPKQLSKELNEAKQKVVEGGTYVHYKHPAKTYKIVQVAVLEATDEVAVVYRAQYGEGFTFVRTLREWLELVDWEGKTVSRFTHVD